MTISDLQYRIEIYDKIKRHIEMTEREYLKYLTIFVNYNDEFKDLFLDSLKLMEYYSTNKIESVSDIKTAFLLKKQKCSTPIDKLEKVYKAHNFILTEKDIKYIHSKVVYGADAVYSMPGEYRNKTVWIGNPKEGIQNAFHVPPQPEKLNSLMHEFVSFYNENDNKDEFFNHPFIKPSISHAALVNIHPFADGNGRTSRLIQCGQIWNLTMERYGIELISPAMYLSKNIKLYVLDYFKRLNSLHKDDTNDNWNNWFEFNLNMMDEQLYYLKINIDKISETYQHTKTLRY